MAAAQGEVENLKHLRIPKGAEAQDVGLLGAGEAYRLVDYVC